MMRRNDPSLPAGCSAEMLEPRRLLSVSFDLTFADDGSHSAYYAPIRSHMLAAAADWGSRFAGNASLQIVVRFSPDTLRASGHSVVSHFYRFNGQYNVSEEGAVYELRTGIDPNGTAPDIEIFFQDDYLINEMWFDPDPATRSAPTNPNRVDAYSVCLHELGHALGFNGFKDGTGAVPADYVSRWDEYVVPNGDNLVFTGPAAEAVYGGPVPVTYGLPNHIGNRAPRPGPDLVPDLMNGVVFLHGKRYFISDLDFAVVKDVGVPVRPPATVVGRQAFYNHSSFDGNDAAANGADDDAIAPDKNALLPGQDRLPGFDNVTSFSKGLNGVMVDIAGLPQDRALTAADFEFRSGPDLSRLSAGPSFVQVAVRPGAGALGSDRVTITWSDYDPNVLPLVPVAVANGWLSVTVKANANTGLAQPDVFSFGNLIGETGDGGAAAGWRVSALDLGVVKRALNSAAGITAAADANHDGRVNALDLGIVKRNLNRALSSPLSSPLVAPSPRSREQDAALVRVAEEIL